MKDEILKLEQELLTAMIESNVEVLDRLISNSLVFTLPDGTVASKEMDLAAHKSGFQKILKLEQSNQRLTLFDEVAVVEVDAFIEGSAGDVSITGNYKYLRVWAKYEGRFQIVFGYVKSA